MFTNTAYEALYQYLGLQLHANFIEVITSQKVFGAVILLIFGVMFFMTTAQFFSRYLPGVLVQRRSVPLSRYVKMIFCLFLGISLLKIGSNTSVKSYTGESWHQNAYIKANGTSFREDYRVSFVFDVLSRSAEEVSALISRVVDSLFAKTNSQLEAPNFFYKAVMLAGATTITDPGLRESVEFYTDECIEKVLPLVGTEAARDKIDPFFGGATGTQDIERQLSMIEISKVDDRPYTCLDAKNEMRERLVAYTRDNSDAFRQAEQHLPGIMQSDVYGNLKVSMSLTNLYREKNETFAGIQKGAQPPSGSARVFQYLNRAFSWDGIMSLFGSENHGASMAAERSQEFSENLSRAPHVAGFIKMGLIAIFPWLVFALVAGHWRVLILWYSAYFSVLLWTPIWTLLYHIVTSIFAFDRGDAGSGQALRWRLPLQRRGCDLAHELHVRRLLLASALGRRHFQRQRPLDASPGDRRLPDRARAGVHRRRKIHRSGHRIGGERSPLMSTGSCLQFDARRPLGRLPRARNGGRQGRPADRPGGLGGAANQGRRPAGDITCLACPLRHSPFYFCLLLHHFGFRLVSFSRSFLHHFSFPSIALPRSVVAAFCISILSTACVSAPRTDAQMLRVLEAEAHLLEKLKEERRHPPLLNKLHADESLSEAEANLRDSIDALIRANAELRSTIKQR